MPTHPLVNGDRACLGLGNNTQSINQSALLLIFYFYLEYLYKSNPKPPWSTEATLYLEQTQQCTAFLESATSFRREA
jgi:hypothetical protein